MKFLVWYLGLVAHALLLLLLSGRSAGVSALLIVSISVWSIAGFGLGVHAAAHAYKRKFGAPGANPRAKGE